MSNTCFICHEKGQGCCFFKADNSYSQIGLFSQDIERIEKYSNISRDEFIVEDTISNDLRESLFKDVHPIFDTIYKNNISLKLKTIEERCIFLREIGCSLPNEIRPIYCRIYPFFPSKDYNHINVLSSLDCLAQQQSTLNWEIVNKHFKYSKEYLMGLFDEMRNY